MRIIDKAFQNTLTLRGFDSDLTSDVSVEEILRGFLPANPKDLHEAQTKWPSGRRVFSTKHFEEAMKAKILVAA